MIFIKYRRTSHHKTIQNVLFYLFTCKWCRWEQCWQLISCRATTTYLVTARIDMLPKPLTEDICSLRSNVDRLAFSVLWEMTPDIQTVGVKFSKSVIRYLQISSITQEGKLSYVWREMNMKNEHIQKRDRSRTNWHWLWALLLLLKMQFKVISICALPSCDKIFFLFSFIVMHSL